jgi:hypothetical protein
MAAPPVSSQCRAGTGTSRVSCRACPDHCAPTGPGVRQRALQPGYGNNTLGLPYGCPSAASFASHASTFWSSSANANNSSNAWNVNFNNGNCNNTHAAVLRLQSFMHSFQARDVGAGTARARYFLQLDAANFFVSLDRRILFGLLQRLSPRRFARGN